METLNQLYDFAGQHTPPTVLIIWKICTFITCKCFIPIRYAFTVFLKTPPLLGSGTPQPMTMLTQTVATLSVSLLPWQLPVPLYRMPKPTPSRYLQWWVITAEVRLFPWALQTDGSQICFCVGECCLSSTEHHIGLSITLLKKMRKCAFFPHCSSSPKGNCLFLPIGGSLPSL